MTADFDESGARGFYLIAPNCDSSTLSSDGIFVYIAVRTDVVSVGDRVQVKGLVQEYYGMTEIISAPEDVEMISEGNNLPVPHDLDPPAEDYSSRLYNESLEAMLLKIDLLLLLVPPIQMTAPGW